MQLSEKAMHVARILANQQPLKRPEDRGQAGSEEALSETLNPLIGFNPNEGPIEVAFDDGGLQADNLQKSPTFIYSMGARLLKTADRPQNQAAASCMANLLVVSSATFYSRNKE